jgi:hypothetical protein
MCRKIKKKEKPVERTKRAYYIGGISKKKIQVEKQENSRLQIGVWGVRILTIVPGPASYAYKFTSIVTVIIISSKARQ